MAHHQGGVLNGIMTLGEPDPGQDLGAVRERALEAGSDQCTRTSWLNFALVWRSPWHWLSKRWPSSTH